MKKEKLEKWSLGKNNGKLIPEGGEILKSIGSELLLIDFHRTEGTWTTDPPKPVTVRSIRDYQPMSGTYLIEWEDKDGVIKAERITPEGFSFNNPEEDGWMRRFQTYSLHFKTMEEELYYGRLKKKFERSENVLPIEVLMTLAKGKQKETLGYHNYIAAVIDTDVEGGIGQGILSFRIAGITKIDRRAKSWTFGLRDWDGNYVNVAKYAEDPEKGWICKNFSVDGTVLGDLKVIDIEDPKVG